MYLIYLRPNDMCCLIKILQKYGIKWCSAYPPSEHDIKRYVIEGKVGLLINVFYSDECFLCNEFVFIDDYWHRRILRRGGIKHEIKEVKSINEFIGKFLVDKNDNAV